MGTIARQVLGGGSCSESLRATLAPGNLLPHPESPAPPLQVRRSHSVGAAASAPQLEPAGVVPKVGQRLGSGRMRWADIPCKAPRISRFLTRTLQTKEETKLPAVCRLSPSPSRRSLHAPVNIERRQKPGGICISHLPANEQQEDHTETPARCYYQYVH